jgi:hypothetical protein
MHRDIALRNIIVPTSGSSNVVVTDFNLSVFLDPPSDYRRITGDQTEFSVAFKEHAVPCSHRS